MFFHWMDQIIYQAVFMTEKRMFCSVKASGVWCTDHMHFVSFLRQTNTCRMDASLVSCSCGCQHLHQFLLYFRTAYNKSPLNRNSCLSAVEIPDLEPLHAFGIPIVSIPRAIRFPVQRIPPCPWNSEKPSMVSYWVFSGIIAQFYIISFKQSCTYQAVVIE